MAGNFVIDAPFNSANFGTGPIKDRHGQPFQKTIAPREVVDFRVFWLTARGRSLESAICLRYGNDNCTELFVGACDGNHINPLLSSRVIRNEKYEETREWISFRGVRVVFFRNVCLFVYFRGFAGFFGCHSQFSLLFTRFGLVKGGMDE